MRQHVTLLASLLIAHSALGLIVAIIVFISVAGGGMLSGDAEAMFITSTVATVIGGFLTLLALPGLLAGFGLIGRKPWARILGMIVSILSLPSVPLGTALGIYGIWVLAKEETAQLFKS